MLANSASVLAYVANQMGQLHIRRVVHSALGKGLNVVNRPTHRVGPSELRDHRQQADLAHPTIAFGYRPALHR
jgi:hypothetical protein